MTGARQCITAGVGAGMAPGLTVPQLGRATRSHLRRAAAALPRVWWPHEDPLLPPPTRLSSPRSWCTSNSLTHLPRSHPLAVHRRETSSSTRPRPSIPPRPSQPRTSCSTSRCLTSPTTEGLPPAVYPHKLSHRPPRPARLNTPTSHSTFRASPTRGSAATACSPTRPTPLPSPSHSPTHHPSRVHTAVESPIRTGEDVGVDEDGNVYVAEGPASLSDAGSAFTKYVVAGM